MSRKLVALLALGLLVRLPFVFTLHLGNDESHLLYDSWLMSLGMTPFKDFPSRSLPLLIALQPVIGFHSLFLARMMSVLAALITGVLLYLLARRISERAALIAVALFLLEPYGVLSTAQVMNAPQLMMWTAFGMLLLLERRYLLSGVSFALGMMSAEYGAYALVVSAPILLAKRKFLTPYPHVFLGAVGIITLLILLFTPNLIYGSTGLDQPEHGGVFLTNFIPRFWGWASAAYQMVGRYPLILLLPLLYPISLLPPMQPHAVNALAFMLSLVLAVLVICATSAHPLEMANEIITAFNIQYRGYETLAKHLPRIMFLAFLLPLSVLMFLQHSSRIKYDPKHAPFLLWLAGASMLLFFPKWHTYYLLSFTPPICALAATALETASKRMWLVVGILLFASWSLTLTYPYRNTVSPSTAYQVASAIRCDGECDGGLVSNPMYAYLAGRRILFDMSHPVFLTRPPNSTLSYPTPEEFDEYVKLNPPQYVVKDPYTQLNYGSHLDQFAPPEYAPIMQAEGVEVFIRECAKYLTN